MPSHYSWLSAFSRADLEEKWVLPFGYALKHNSRRLSSFSAQWFVSRARLIATATNGPVVVA